MKTLGIIALIMLMGCGDKTERHAKAGDHLHEKLHTVTLDETQFFDGRGIHKLHMVTLENGTRCVVYSGPDKGGIDCNWAETARDLPRDLPR